MKIFYLIISSLFISLSHANSIAPFMEGLKNDLLLNGGDRARELHYHVRVRAFGPLGRIMSPDAVATYNGNLNVISLDEALLSQGNIRDAREIRGPQYAVYKNSTIFHELGHAELDVFIEEKEHAEDKRIMQHYETVLRPFYKKHFPSFNPHTVFHEHFAYYRSELIDILYDEMDRFYSINGYNKNKNTCYMTMQLKKNLASGMSLEEFSALIEDAKVASISDRIGPQYVFVKGKDIDLYKVPGHQAILGQTYKLFWNYHRAFYGQASDQKELTKRFTERSPVAKTIKACREKAWKDFHTSK